MKINQLSKISGFSISTIYDYLRTGLLHPPIKNGPTKSFFDTSHVNRLKKIRHLKETEKLSLTKIRARLSINDKKAPTPKDTIREIKIQIVDKALELFSKHHYEDTKVSDLTAELNMGSGTFYKYFKSKEELFLDCLDRLPEVLVPKEAWNEVKNEKDYISRLKKRGYAMLNAFPSYIAILNYAKLSLSSENKNLSQKAAECIKKLVSPLKKDLQLAQLDGKVRKINEELVAYLLLGINETFFHRMLIDSTYTIEEGFSIIEDFLSHALSNGKKTNSESDTIMTSFSLTDCNQNKIEIEDLQFDKKNYIIGNYLAGKLQISVDAIFSAEFKKKEDLLFAHVTGEKKDAVIFSIDPTVTISGVAQFGKFIVTVDKISRIERIEI